MSKKKLNKTVWYGSDVDLQGNAILPPLAEGREDLNGIHEGEIYLHNQDDDPGIWVRTNKGNVKRIGFNKKDLDLSEYLKKQVWDTAWELRTTEEGESYIFCKLPFVSQNGITLYADGGKIDLPSLYAGIPFDNRTIWLNPETKLVEVIGGTGGGEGGVSNFWDLTNIPTWITATKPEYSYGEIKETPDLSEYAKITDVDSRINDLVNGAPQAYDTLKEIADVLQGNVNSIGDIITTLGTKADKTYVDAELGKYIPIAGDTEVTGIKNFLNGLKVGGLPISKYEGYDDVIYIDANVVLRGGLTQYVVDPATIPSIIESLPQAGYESKGVASFSSEYFVIDANGKVSIIPDSVGLNEGELIEWLANSDYATKTYVGGQLESYALQSALTDTNNTLATKWTQDDDKIANWDTAYSWGNHASAGYALSTEVAVELAKYLPLKGGTINGNLIVEGNISIDSKKTIKIQGGYSILGLTDNVYFVGATNHPTNIKSDGTLTHNNATIWDSNTLTSLSQLTNDADFTTNAYVNETFVTLKGDPQTIEGEKNFTEGLKVNGSPIVYDSEKGYWKLQGNLLITGGLTQYVDDGSVDLPNLYDGLPIDRDTIYWDNGLLKAKVAEGGITSITKDMVVEALGFTPYDASNPNGYITSAALNGYATQTWVKQQGFLTKHQDLSGYQTKITSTNKLAYSLISGTPDLSVYLTTSSASSTYQPKITSSAKLAASLVSGLATVATSGSYNDLSNKPTIPTNTNQLTNGAGFITSAALADYLPLSGGTLTSSTNTPLTLKSTLSESWLSYHNNNGWVASIGVTSSGVLSFYNGVSNKIWHERNDGSGSGLDADLLDGLHWSSFTYNYSDSSTTAGTHYIKLGTLPVSSSGTHDSFCIQGSIGGWESYNKSYIKLSIGRREKVTYIGTVNNKHSSWDIAVNNAGEVLLVLYSQYTSWSLSITTIQGTISPTKNVTPSDTNFTYLSASGNVEFVDGSGATAKANKLSTARTIWGQSFDGTGDVVGDFICQYLRIERFNEINSYTDYANKVSASLHLQYRTNGNATLCYGGGNVGIGTTSPQYKLEVNGNGRFNKYLVIGASLGQSNTARAQLDLVSPDANPCDLHLGADNTRYWSITTRNNTDATFGGKGLGFYDAVNSTYRMCITQSGNVGIGITGPEYKLHIQGSSTTSGDIIRLDSSASYSGIVYRPNGGLLWSTCARNDDHSFYVYNNYIGGMTLQIFRDGGVYVRGNVGIGTTSPTNKLTILGNSRCTYMEFWNTSLNGSAGYIGRGSSGNNHLYLYSYNNLYFGTNGVADNMSLDSSANLLVKGGITQYSDIRKKTKLNDVELTLKQVANAPLIEHYYNSDDKKTTHVGSIAQYWADMNDWFCKLDSDGFYTMEIQNAALASAISVARELERYESKTDKKIRMLRKRINELEDEIETLKKGA